MATDPAATLVLALNAGSSSVKAGLFAFPPSGERGGPGVGGGAPAGELLATGSAESIGGDRPGQVSARTAAGAVLADEERTFADQAEATDYLVERFARGGAGWERVGAVGHRFVHGGPTLREHRVIDEAVRAALVGAADFAPLHVPSALAVLDAARRRFPGVAQVACLDTAFHRTLPEVAARLPLPDPWWERGVRRYGFHGLSCESAVNALGGQLRPRAVLAHLGSGASVTALREGVSVDTSMGLTPTGGFLMGTRTGDLDPGVVLYLLRHGGLDADGIESLVDHRAGLLGVSGLTSDLRRLLAERDHHPRARLAVEMFAYQVRKSVAGMAAALEGMDQLIFTGGIGEHSRPVRAAVCAGLAHLGIELDPDANERDAGVISRAGSRCAAHVVVADEDQQIARHAFRLLLGSPRPGSGEA